MNHKQILNQPLLQEASSLLIVTALCGAGGALTTTANAAVTATPGISPATPLLIPPTLNGIYINAITGPGAVGVPGSGVAGWDIEPYTSSLNNPGINFFNSSGGGLLDVPGGSAGPTNLPVGAIVDATNPFGFNIPVPFGANPGDWIVNGSNNFGFRFVDEADGSTHYGWGRMLVGADPNTRFITQMFYESTPNVGITVVPEPTSAFLAAGAAGLLTLRRRRRLAA